MGEGNIPTITNTAIVSSDTDDPDINDNSITIITSVGDIDECALGLDNCDPVNATCTNIPDSFTCVCNPGYTGDGVTCQPVGACCADDGTCQELTAADCGVAGGVYDGDGTTCDPNQCPQPTGTVIIIKEANPEDGTDFNFTFNSTTQNIPFQLDDDSDATLSNSKTFTVPSGTYNFVETLTDGWDLTGISCENTNATSTVRDRKVIIRINAGGQVTCTFTNEKQTSLTIVKEAGPEDGTDFAFTSTVPGNDFGQIDSFAVSLAGAGQGIAVDSNGNIYVVDINGNVEKFDSSGAATGFSFNAGLSSTERGIGVDGD